MTEPEKPTEQGGTPDPMIGRDLTGPLLVKRWPWIVVILLVVYGVGLTRDLSEPWWGLQDWNGAFFSQLARNHLRYPWSLHQGMPVVAAGEAVPTVGEYSIYATHPPGLVWLVATAFALLGESEAVARLVPIVFSLGAFALLLCVVRRGWNTAVAVVFGLIYALLPMSVYFGRMVDHEALCLACAAAVLYAYVRLTEFGADGLAQQGTPRQSSAPEPSRATRFGLRALLLSGLTLGIWIDWFGVLFGGVFCLYLLATDMRERARRLQALVICAVALLALGSMLAFIVYAGLEGRWSDLIAIFTSRAGEREDVTGGRGGGLWWRYAIDNLTAPVLLLGLLGLPKLLRGGPSADSWAALARRGLMLLTLSGAIWLAVFWRQFLRHEYWMFYLGPAFALSAALTVTLIWETGVRHGLKATRLAAAVLLAATLAYEFQGTSALYSRQDRPTEEIADLKAIHAATAAGDRVVLFENPYRVERRGDYEFRNIVPPQLPYYLDRAFTVTGRISDLPVLAGEHRVFVRPRDGLLRRPLSEAEREALEQWPQRALGLYLLYDLSE